MRIFLDANILFSAAKSNGAVRQLLSDFHADGHSMVADGYVAAEARRNIAAKAAGDAVDYLEALLSRIEVREVHPGAVNARANWLPEKDRPVLLAAIALKCNVLVTGDSTHFGEGYGKTFEGVTVYSPAQLSLTIWGDARAAEVVSTQVSIPRGNAMCAKLAELNPSEADIEDALAWARRPGKPQNKA